MDFDISNKESSKAIVSNIYLAYQELKNAYISQGFISIQELKDISSKYSTTTMLSALNSRIADTNVSYANIFDVVGNINKNFAISVTSANNLIRDVYLYKLYQEVFDSTVTSDSFFDIGNTTSSPVDIIPTAISRWADMLTGLITPTSTNDTYVKLAQFKLPTSTTFKIGAVSIQRSGDVYNIYAPNTLNSGGIGYNPNIVTFFPTSDDFIKRIKKGAYSSIVANWYQMTDPQTHIITTATEDLTSANLPNNLTIGQIIEYFTGISATDGDLSTLSINQISSIADLIQSSTQNIVDSLYNAMSNDSHKIPKWKIFGAAQINALIRNDLLNKTYNDIWDYIPNSVSEGLPETLTRPVSNLSTDVYKYTNSVIKINVFADFLGLNAKQLTDKFTGIEPTTDFSKISYELSKSQSSNTRIDYYDSTLTYHESSRDIITKTNVLSSWRHYKNVSIITNLALLQTASLIADYLSDDFTKTFSTSPNFNKDELNDIEGRWTNYLNACNGTSNIPSTSIDIIYEALKIIAQHKITINNLSDNVHSSLLKWFINLPYIPNKTDSPEGQTQDSFWGENIHDLTNEINAKRVFAKYILNPEGQPFFKLLNNISNIKFFTSMVKIGTSQTTIINQEQIYGLDGACDVNSGTPISNWGTSSQIQTAMNGLAGWSENLKISRDLAVISTITTWSDLETKILPNYTLEKIVNLPKPLQKKYNNEYIIDVLPGNKVFSKDANMPNMLSGSYLGQTTGSELSKQLNQKLYYVAMLFDIANKSGTTDYEKAKYIQKLIDILSDSTYKQFLEMHVNYSENNIETHKEIFSNLLKNKFVSKFGKYGKTSQWRNIIVNTLNTVFGESMLDEIMVTTSPDYLTLSKSNLLKIIGNQIHYQLTAKMAYIDPVTNKPELREGLVKYVSDINTNQHYTKNIALGLAVAARSGNQFRLSRGEYNDLKNAGVSEDTIKRMVVARPNINGYAIGGVNFYALVGQNPTTGALLFE